jgi:cysteinyl-tRNA synthetase
VTKVGSRVLLTVALVGVLTTLTVWAVVATRPDPVHHRFTPTGQITRWAYQLQDYPGGKLDQLAAGKSQLVVVDLARDAGTDYFRADEIAKVRATGKYVLAYFEIGSIEDFRPEFPVLKKDAPDLIANPWADWPGESFVRYWDARWWRLVVQPRVDQALRAGFDGVYLDTPLAYEQIDAAGAQGRDRTTLGADMTALIARISAYAKQRRPGFLIVPQNSPELRHHRGYTQAIDGIGMEELFYQATDKPCTEDWCAENLADTRALRAAGKFVLSVDYASRAADITSACARYRSERFAGTVTDVALDRTTPPCV